MDKEELHYSLESQVALSHLLIAGLALLTADNRKIQFILSDGSMTGQLKIPDLLRMMKSFPINEYDKSGVYLYPLELAAKLMELENPSRDPAIKLYINAAIQVPLVRVYEFLKSYCKKSPLKERFQRQDWYLVAQVIRNCFSHDFNLNVRRKLRKKLPFIWKNITITKEMLGRPLKFSDAKIKSLNDLFNTMVAFGNELISEN